MFWHLNARKPLRRSAVVVMTDGATMPCLMFCDGSELASISCCDGETQRRFFPIYLDTEEEVPKRTRTPQAYAMARDRRDNWPRLPAADFG